MRALVILTLAFTACSTPGPNRPPVTPQRPTVAADTSTTAKGSFELEAGVALDPSTAFDAPMTIKHGAGEATEINVGFNPFTWRDQGGCDESGFGDMTFALRHRFLEGIDERPSAAFQFTTKLPTADEDKGLSSGEIDFFPAAIVTQGFGDLTATLYYQLGILGDPQGTGTDIQPTGTAMLAASFTDRIGAVVEFAGIDDPGPVDPIFTTLAVSYAWHPALVFDAGVVFGLNDDAADAQFVIGVTTNFGQLAP